MLSAALTCSWESRGKSEQSCSALTESEEGATQQPDREDGNYSPTRGKNPEPALRPPLPSAPLARPPATMRADFALVLTAVLLLDAFRVRFRLFLRAELRVRGASSWICRRRRKKLNKVAVARAPLSTADSFGFLCPSALIGPVTSLTEPVKEPSVPVLIPFLWIFGFISGLKCSPQVKMSAHSPRRWTALYFLL